MLETRLYNPVGSPVECEISAAMVAEREASAEGPELPGFVGIIKNVQERNKLQRQAFEAQRKEGLAVLAGGIAHDFNNLMQGVIGQAEMMLQDRDSSEDNRNRLRTIMDSAIHSAELCQQLLQYAGKGIVDSGSVSLSEVVGEVFDFLKSSIPDGVNVRTQVGDGSEVIQGDPTLIQQVLINLISNALDAVGKKGTVSVRVLTHLTGNRTGLEVSDDGPGMDAATLERIFDPFYSTKAGSDGLGLSAVEGIVSRTGGKLDVISTPGAGTTFRLTFQRFNDDAPSVKEAQPVGPDGRNILLVDSDPAQQDLTRSLLVSEGFQVESVQGAQSAVTLLARPGELRYRDY